MLWILLMLLFLSPHFVCAILSKYHKRNLSVPVCRFDHSGVVTETNCPICYSDFEPDTLVVKISNCKCKLVYCPECFKEWGKCTVCGTTPPENKVARFWIDRASQTEIYYLEFSFKLIFIILQIIILIIQFFMLIKSAHLFFNAPKI